MRNEEFDCTAYWQYGLHALPDKASYAGVPSLPMKIQLNPGELTVYVNGAHKSNAEIEASARLDLSALGPEAGAISLTYFDASWQSFPWAPAGVGSKMNALVPWRDVASSVLPFGTRLTIAEVEGYPELRGRLFVGDVFGKKKEKDRMDLFFGRPADKFRRPVRMLVEEPDTGCSPLACEGAQECLNKLRFLGQNGKPLVVDGKYGTQTNHALLTWRSVYMGSVFAFPYGAPARFRPEDPEVYFMLRHIAFGAPRPHLS